MHHEPVVEERHEAAGLKPEDWVCGGWGWYRSRLGAVATRVSRAGHRMRRTAARLAGERSTSHIVAIAIRHPAINWMGAEQIVRARAVK